jgi:hypothetical protein
MSSWNGQDLGQVTPNLGFTLSSAQLIPSFIEQALALDLFARVQDTQITPLDDLKNWLRQDPYRTGELVGQVHELLLGEEDKARAVAEKAGVQFDVVGYELEEMESDPTYEAFNAEWTGIILKLLIEEADSLQAWSKRENGMDLAMAVSFQLPDPRKHPRFSPEQIAQALAAHGAKPEALAAISKGRKAPVELSGAFQIDLSASGEGPRYERKNGVGFVKVPCADMRAGDECVAHLSMAYPLEAEGYFLLTFDELRKTLTLKNADDGD